MWTICLDRVDIYIQFGVSCVNLPKNCPVAQICEMFLQLCRNIIWKSCQSGMKSICPRGHIIINLTSCPQWVLRVACFKFQKSRPPPLFNSDPMVHCHIQNSHPTLQQFPWIRNCCERLCLSNKKSRTPLGPWLFDPTGRLISPVRYPWFLIEWIIHWIKCSQFQHFE